MLPGSYIIIVLWPCLVEEPYVKIKLQHLYYFNLHCAHMEHFPKLSNYCKPTEQQENEFFLNESFKLLFLYYYFTAYPTLSSSTNCMNPIADLKDLRNGLTNILLYFVYK